MIYAQEPTRSPSGWRRRRRFPVSAVITWGLLAVALGWLLLSALVGLFSVP